MSGLEIPLARVVVHETGKALERQFPEHAETIRETTDALDTGLKAVDLTEAAADAVAELISDGE